MPKTNYEKILGSIISIAFILFALLGSIHFWAFNESFYKSEHDKLTLYGKSIADHIGITDEQLAELTHFTLAYLNDPDASLDLQMEVNGKVREIFTDDEKAHMVDVRNLNLIANYLIIICAVVLIVGFVLIVWKKYSFSYLFKTYKHILLYAFGVIAILGIWILIDFDSFWTMFHHVFFPTNDLWLLDLRKDILIMIVPPDFFNHLVILIVITFIGLLIAFYILLSVLSKRAPR